MVSSHSEPSCAQSNSKVDLISGINSEVDGNNKISACFFTRAKTNLLIGVHCQLWRSNSRDIGRGIDPAYCAESSESHVSDTSDDPPGRGRRRRHAISASRPTRRLFLSFLAKPIMIIWVDHDNTSSYCRIKLDVLKCLNGTSETSSPCQHFRRWLWSLKQSTINIEQIYRHLCEQAQRRYPPNKMAGKIRRTIAGSWKHAGTTIIYITRAPWTNLLVVPNR